VDDEDLSGGMKSLSKAGGDRRAIGPPGAEQAGRPVHGSAGKSGERIRRGRAGGGNFLSKGRAVG
jgi:hypothetical protein